MSEQTNTVVVTPPPRQGWHFGREIPVAVVVALILQALGLVWWTSYWTTTLDNRVNALETYKDARKLENDAKFSAVNTRIDQLVAERDRIIRLEEKVNLMSDILQEIRDDLRSRK